MGVAVLLPHMDDEVFIFPYLRKLKNENIDIEIFFLTKSEGRNNKYNTKTREEESRRFLNKVLPNSRVIFLGNLIEVLDLESHKKFEEIFLFLKENVSASIEQVLTCNFEGGHPDHDTSFFLGQKLAIYKSAELTTFNLYRAKFSKTIFFDVFSGLDATDESTQVKLKIRDLIDLFLVPIRYKSQWRTWLGLYPFMLTKKLIRRKIHVHRPKFIGAIDKPNKGRLLYEKRRDGNFTDWKEYIERHID